MDNKLTEESVKSHVDLWIHQNNLMWSRLQQLAFVQTGFLGLATYLYSTARSTIQLAFQPVFQVEYQEALNTQTPPDALKKAYTAADAALKSASDIARSAAAAAHSPLNLAFYAKYAALLGAVSTFGLLIIALTDKRLRDIYREKIEKIDSDIHPASLQQRAVEEDKWNIRLESLFHSIVTACFL